MTTRAEALDRLRAGETWDVVVIGGGATGLGSAFDAATRGYRTLLLESVDFAKGTSSRSTKLIHGGVRYLSQGNVGLVRESLRERARLLHNAPHIVHDRAFLVPSYDWWGRAYYGIGLRLYDRMAGSLGMGATRSVGPAEAVGLVPTLEPKGLRGGIVYHDGQFDDARLAVALVRSLADAGGVALNAMPVTALVKGATGRLNGVRAVDGETREEFTIPARVVLNATGVFADTLRTLDAPGCPPMIRPSQGAHVVLDRSFLPGETAVMVPKTDDGRVLFAIPWHGRVVVGTTDTPVNSTSEEPRALEEEWAFLLRHAARYLTRDPEPSDVLSVFAGLRPLIAGPGTGGSPTSRLSREHAAIVSDSALVTITGGKWTTYRMMAETAVDLAARVAGLPIRECLTRDRKLHGATDSPDAGPFAAYGSDAEGVAKLVAGHPGWDELVHPKLPYLLGEVAWAARYESARTVEDVLARRTRALFLDARAAAEAAPRVTDVLAAELGRNAAWKERQLEIFTRLASEYWLDA